MTAALVSTAVLLEEVDLRLDSDLPAHLSPGIRSQSSRL